MKNRVCFWCFSSGVKIEGGGFNFGSLFDLGRELKIFRILD